eukprot:ANDGO_00051.mRNA.1 hypothetical protein
MLFSGSLQITGFAYGSLAAKRAAIQDQQERATGRPSSAHMVPSLNTKSIAQPGSLSASPRRPLSARPISSSSSSPLSLSAPSAAGGGGGAAAAPTHPKLSPRRPLSARSISKSSFLSYAGSDDGDRATPTPSSMRFVPSGAVTTGSAFNLKTPMMDMHALGAEAELVSSGIAESATSQRKNTKKKKKRRPASGSQSSRSVQNATVSEPPLGSYVYSNAANLTAFPGTAPPRRPSSATPLRTPRATPVPVVLMFNPLPLSNSPTPNGRASAPRTSHDEQSSAVRVQINNAFPASPRVVVRPQSASRSNAARPSVRTPSNSSLSSVTSASSQRPSSAPSRRREDEVVLRDGDDHRFSDRGVSEWRPDSPALQRINVPVPDGKGRPSAIEDAGSQAHAHAHWGLSLPEGLHDDFLDDFIQNDTDEGSYFSRTDSPPVGDLRKRNESNRPPSASASRPSSAKSVAAVRGLPTTVGITPPPPSILSSMNLSEAHTLPDHVDVSQLSHFRDIEFQLYELTKPYSGPRVQAYRKLQLFCETKTGFCDELRLSGAFVVLMYRFEQIVQNVRAAPEHSTLSVALSSSRSSSSGLFLRTFTGDSSSEMAILPKISELRHILHVVACATQMSASNMQLFRAYGGIRLVQCVLQEECLFSQFPTLDDFASLLHAFFGTGNAENCQLFVANGGVDALMNAANASLQSTGPSIGQICVVLESVPAIVFPHDALFDVFCNSGAPRLLLRVLLSILPVEGRNRPPTKSAAAAAAAADADSGDSVALLYGDKSRRSSLTGSSSSLSSLSLDGPSANVAASWCSGGAATNDMLCMCVIVIAEICQRGFRHLLDEILVNESVVSSRLVTLVMNTPIRTAVMVALRAFLSLSPRLSSAFREYGGLAVVSRVLDSPVSKTNLDVLSETLQLIWDMISAVSASSRGYVERPPSVQDQRASIMDHFAATLDTRLIQIFQFHEKQIPLRHAVCRILLALSAFIQDKKRTSFLIDLLLHTIEAQSNQPFPTDVHRTVFLLEVRVLNAWILDCASNLNKARRHAHAVRWRDLLRREDVLRAPDIRREVETTFNALFS